MSEEKEVSDVIAIMAILECSVKDLAHGGTLVVSSSHQLRPATLQTATMDNAAAPSLDIACATRVGLERLARWT